MFVLPVTMTARTMAVLCGVITLLMLVVDEGNVAHSAHLAGGVAGYLYARYRLAGVSRNRGAVERQSSWLRLVDEQESEVEPWQREEDAENAHDPEEVDRILEKISNNGVGSLTRRERKILEDASRRL